MTHMKCEKCWDQMVLWFLRENKEIKLSSKEDDDRKMTLKQRVNNHLAMHEHCYSNVIRNLFDRSGS